MAIARIVKQVEQMPPFPVLIFANLKYRRLVVNWLECANSAGISNVLVLVPERRLLNELLRGGYRAALLPMNFSKQTLWWRLYIFVELSRRGVSFVHCDADAFVLRNPFPYLERFHDVDLIFSQGTVHPREVVESQGFVACMGFFQVRASQRVFEFFRRALEIAESGKTDQHSANEALAEQVISWMGTKYVEAERSYLGQSFLTFKQPLNGLTASGMKVILLPNYLFQRWVENGESDPFVVHPLAKQHPDAKQASFIEIGLWPVPHRSKLDRQEGAQGILAE